MAVFPFSGNFQGRLLSFAATPALSRNALNRPNLAALGFRRRRKQRRRQSAN
jgi:hypothetical protein